MLVVAVRIFLFSDLLIVSHISDSSVYAMAYGVNPILGSDDFLFWT